MHSIARTALFVTVIASSSVAAADDIDVRYTVEAASVSSYVWRGDLLSADQVAPAIQPYGELDIGIPALANGTLALGLWTSRNVTDTAAQEIDPYAAYTIPVGPTAVRVGYAAYVLPSAEPKDTMHELSLQVTATRWEAFAPFAGVAVDPIRTKGAYAFAGASYTQAVGAGSLVGTVNVGASRYEMLPADLQDVTATARGSYPVGSAGLYVAATAAAGYSGRSGEVHPYGGLSVGLSR